MGYSMHATVPVTLKQRLHPAKHEVDVWTPGRGVPVPLHITQFHLSAPEYAPCSYESCRVAGLGVVNDMKVSYYEWLVGWEVTAQVVVRSYVGWQTAG
jgi:hypothetical protein